MTCGSLFDLERLALRFALVYIHVIRRLTTEGPSERSATFGPKDLPYGNAPDPIFPGRLLRAQFHARRKILPHFPAVADARHQTPRGGARRPPVPARASASASHRARRDRPTSSAASLGAERCGDRTGAVVHRRRPLKAQNRYHVHDRAGSIDRFADAYAKPASSDWIGDRRRLSARPGGTACRRSYRSSRLWPAGQDGLQRRPDSVISRTDGDCDAARSPPRWPAIDTPC